MIVNVRKFLVTNEMFFMVVKEALVLDVFAPKIRLFLISSS